MTNLSLGQGWWKRPYAKYPDAPLVNRFHEDDPTNGVTQSALLSRPPTRKIAAVGPGPGRQSFNRANVFSQALFVVSGSQFWKIALDLTTVHITGTVNGTGTPSIDARRDAVFIADGTALQFYDGVGSRASGTLTSTGTNVANNDTVTINGQVYTFKTALTPVANEVKLGTDAADSLSNLYDAIITNPATIGITYAAATVANAAVYANFPTTTKLVVTARTGGTGGNAVTTTEASAQLSWGAATLSGGAVSALSGIVTPDDVGIVSVAVLGSYVLCAVADSDIIYWINPGEYVIDPLNFVSAESSPDEVTSLITVGDQVWALGAESTQPFYLTGDETVFAPIQGRAFPYGSLEGTAALVGTEVVLVANNGIVYAVAGGPRRVSNNGIENIIRLARRDERAAP